MNEPMATNPVQTTPTTTEQTTPTTAGADDALEGLTTQQMIEKLSGIMGAEAQGMTEAETFRIQQEARNQITDTREMFREELPDATNGQAMDFIEGMMSFDPARVIRALKAALRTEAEVTQNEARGGGEELHVQTGGSGRGSSGPGIHSMGDAVVAAANLFR